MKSLMIGLFIYLSLQVCVSGFDGCSGAKTFDSLPEPRGGKLMHKKQIELTNRQDNICITANFTTNITVRLVDQYTYTLLEQQYFIPKTLNIECVFKHENDDCREHCDVPGEGVDTFEKCDYKPSLFNESGIYKTRDCNSPSSGSCDYRYLNVYSNATKGRDFYRVHKSTGIKKVSVVEVAIYQRSMHPVKERLTFHDVDQIEKVNNSGTVWKFEPSSTWGSETNIFQKCFLEDNDGTFAVVDTCNNDDSITPGIIGEIKCETPNMSNYCSKCIFATNLIKHDQTSSVLKSRSKCELTIQDYKKVFEKSSLPRSFDDVQVEPRSPGRFGSIQAIHSDFAFSLQMEAELPIAKFTTPEECTLKVKNRLNLSGSIKSKGTSFSVLAKANQRIQIKTKCKLLYVPVVVTNNETAKFTQYNISFNPSRTFLDTICTIYCGNDKKQIKLTGTFLHRSPSIENTKIVLSDEDEYKKSGLGFIEDLLSQLIEQIMKLWALVKNYIIGYLDDPKVIIAASFLILFTVYALFTCIKSPFVLLFNALSCCCGIFKPSKTKIKKKKYVDEV